MIVVSDTSPLNYLVLLGAVDVLPKLFREIHVPSEVMRELHHPRTPEPLKRWAQSPPDWLCIHAPSKDIPLVTGLDPGEAQAIALALELRADAVLIDEKKGRGTPSRRGSPLWARSPSSN
jgi:predicted nucleic acid-binding protein